MARAKRFSTNVIIKPKVKNWNILKCSVELLSTNFTFETRLTNRFKVFFYFEIKSCTHQLRLVCRYFHSLGLMASHIRPKIVLLLLRNFSKNIDYLGRWHWKFGKPRTGFTSRPTFFFTPPFFLCPKKLSLPPYLFSLSHTLPLSLPLADSLRPAKMCLPLRFLTIRLFGCMFICALIYSFCILQGARQTCRDGWEGCWWRREGGGGISRPRSKWEATWHAQNEHPHT